METRTWIGRANGIALHRLARGFFDRRDREPKHNRAIMGSEHERRSSRRFVHTAFGRARIPDVARAHIYRRKMQKGARREYSAARGGAVRRGQSVRPGAKEGTDISRRKRRFRVVVPLFAVGIIIGSPGNPGRVARWLARFRVRRRWKPDDDDDDDGGIEGRATSGLVPWQTGESEDLHGRGGTGARGWVRRELVSGYG